MILVPSGVRVWLATGHTDIEEGLCKPVAAGAGGAAARSAERTVVLLSWSPEAIFRR